MNKKTQTLNHSDYKDWIIYLKSRVRQVQLKAAVAVNEQLINFYWELGSDILEKQKDSTWGKGFLEQVSRDLMVEFPDMTGFSARNLRAIRQWVLFWNNDLAIRLQAVAKLTQLPWGHNLTIITKSLSSSEALYYVESTLKHGWSRSVLTHQIESDLWKRDGKAISNFSQTLPPLQSDLAHQTLKDPYVFNFLNLMQEASEKELEKNLIEHITQFLLELGTGFAYVGKQVPLQVGERDFFVDLLFYHTHLHCYVVVELKTVAFEPEHIGKLNFYIKAVDMKFRRENDAPTIGLLLCKYHDKVVAEYSLSDVNKPIGVSEYKITQSLPEKLKSSLPTIEEIEAELTSKKFELLETE